MHLILKFTVLEGLYFWVPISGLSQKAPLSDPNHNPQLSPGGPRCFRRSRCCPHFEGQTESRASGSVVDPKGSFWEELRTLMPQEGVKNIMHCRWIKHSCYTDAGKKKASAILTPFLGKILLKWSHVSCRWVIYTRHNHVVYLSRFSVPDHSSDVKINICFHMYCINIYIHILHRLYPKSL